LQFGQRAPGVRDRFLPQRRFEQRRDGVGLGQLLHRRRLVLRPVLIDLRLHRSAHFWQQRFRFGGHCRRRRQTDEHYGDGRAHGLLRSLVFGPWRRYRWKQGHSEQFRPERRRLMLHSLVLSTVAAFLAAPVFADDLKLSEDEMAVVELTNAERKKADLPPLKPNSKLFAAARAHVTNMARQDKLAHDLDDKTPEDRITAAGYMFSRWGENIGWRGETPKAAIAEWMDSPIHKDNILNKEFTEIGVAVAKNEKGERYWVQVFAAARD